MRSVHCRDAIAEFSAWPSPRTTSRRRGNKSPQRDVTDRRVFEHMAATALSCRAPCPTKRNERLSDGLVLALAHGSHACKTETEERERDRLGDRCCIGSGAGD